MKDTGQRRKEYDAEHPQPGHIHRVYDDEGAELGYGKAYEDGYGLMWEVHVPSPRGFDTVVGVEDTRLDVELRIMEWFNDD